MEKIREFAIKHGYKDVEYIGEWEGFNVYEPIKDVRFLKIGLPFKILEKDGKIKISTTEEIFEIMDALFEESKDKL